ncbi:MAG TPA: hypothetical protein VGO96_17740 [Pyrinomonadaceae bacterium]|jgi:phenylalanyl-tRNA synthetase beta subunit|nr:hypothetical protein [Pyrinomonadaceae bacterium]
MSSGAVRQEPETLRKAFEQEFGRFARFSGRRSTLRLEYRAGDRTLRDEEVDELHSRIVKTLEDKFSTQLKR